MHTDYSTLYSFLNFTAKNVNILFYFILFFNDDLGKGEVFWFFRGFFVCVCLFFLFVLPRVASEAYEGYGV